MNIERDSDLEAAIRSHLDEALQSGVEIFCYDQVGSVLDVARVHIAPILSKDYKALILAKNQSNGRGQQGRSWTAVQKAFLGCLLFPDCTISKSELPAFSLVIAIQIAHTLLEYGVEVGVKWPNDVLTRKEGNKISGVLLEADSSLRVGIGVNLSGSPENGTSIQEEIKLVVDLDRFSASIVKSCLIAFDQFKSEGFAPFEKQWASLDLISGREIKFQITDKTYIGIASGVDSAGRFLLEIEGEKRAFTSGQILLPLSLS